MEEINATVIQNLSLIRKTNAEENLKAIRCLERRFYQPPQLQIQKENMFQVYDYLMWRRDMAAWLVDTAALYNVQAETIEVAQSVLDRFSFIDKDIREDFELFQLACFVCLTIACKTLETKRQIKRSKIQRLSQGYFSQEEFDCMELHILYSLQWHIHPPTTIEITQNLFDLIPMDILPDRERVEQSVMARLQTVLLDASFIPFNTSTIAVAALLAELRPIIKDLPLNKLRSQFEVALELESSCQTDVDRISDMFERNSLAAKARPLILGVRATEKFPYNVDLDDLSTDLSSSADTPSSSPRSVLVDDYSTSVANE